MKYSKAFQVLAIISLVIITLSVALTGAGCSENTSSSAAVELGATMVPPVDLDVYLYVNQQTPTEVPKSLTGASADFSVQSLAIWGIVNSDTEYTVAGALTLTSPDEASAIFKQIPESDEIYLKLSGSVIYFLKGSGSSADSIKNAIDNNNFKQYDDTKALAELANLPSGGTTIPGLIGIVKPNQTSVNLAKQYLDKDTADALSSVYSNAKPQVIALGVFGSKALNLADMSQKISDDTVWDMDLGIVVSMNSAYPGLIFSPLANHFISSEGFTEVKVGDLTAYQYPVDLGSGKNIPLYLNVSGNHIYCIASGNDSYAQTLLTGINR